MKTEFYRLFPFLPARIGKICCSKEGLNIIRKAFSYFMPCTILIAALSRYAGNAGREALLPFATQPLVICRPLSYGLSSSFFLAFVLRRSISSLALLCPSRSLSSSIISAHGWVTRQVNLPLRGGSGYAP